MVGEYFTLGTNVKDLFTKKRLCIQYSFVFRTNFTNKLSIIKSATVYDIMHMTISTCFVFQFMYFYRCNCLQVNPSLLVTHDISMKDYKNAFQTLVSGDCCKVLIDPSDP